MQPPFKFGFSKERSKAFSTYQKQIRGSPWRIPLEGVIFLYTVFGWGEFRGDGKHRKENVEENNVFHRLAS